MKSFFFLSGEHKSLPAAEALAVLEALGLDFRVEDAFEHVLVLEIDGSREELIEAGERLALSHCICEFAGSCGTDRGAILDLVSSIDINLGESYAVRVRRVGKRSRDLNTGSLEAEIGRVLSNRGARVDLEDPETTVYGVLGERFVYGRRLFEVDRGSFEGRRPHLRPYFHPSSMLPRLARAVVNLTRIKKGGKLMDPFCGTGGFLIEAGLVGASVFGADIDPEMISGCRKNLQHVGIDDFAIMQRDFRELAGDYEACFDAVVTDPPYGKSSTTKGLSLEELYGGAFQLFKAILKPGGHACVVGPSGLEIEKFASEESFEIREKYSVRIHKSLTRDIVVLKR